MFYTHTHTMGCFGSTLAVRHAVRHTEAKIPNEFIAQAPVQEQEKPKNELIDILARQRPGSYLKYTAIASALQKQKRGISPALAIALRNR